jgi:hypothetical protein
MQTRPPVMSSAMSFASPGCAIISLTGLQGRRNKTVDWTKVMKDAPRSRTSLAFFLGPNKAKTLVMVRNYGAIDAVLLTDDAEDQSFMRIPVAQSAEFLEPYADDLVAPELNDYYDRIQLYTSSHGLTLLGPLSSARAAFALKNFPVNEAEAIELAEQQARTLMEQQAARGKTIEQLLAAEREKANSGGFLG